jgi:sugar lactone lactonase YvrE
MKRISAILLLCLLAIAVRAQDSVTTLAGQALVSGTADGTSTNAQFNDPAAMVTDANGDLFVADSQNHAIRKITTNGVVTVFAGQLGVAGTRDGTGTNAQFNTPSGLAFDALGNLYVADTANHTIRKITPAAAVSTIAGIAGFGGYADGAAGTAQFSSPLGLAVAANGDLFVADSGNHCIRQIASGAVSTFAGEPKVWGTADGSGTNAQFNGPLSLAFDKLGHLFVSDANNDTIREITTSGVVTTFAGLAGADGTTDGNLRVARFRSPAGLVFDPPGNLFIADSFNQTIREISPNGVVSTLSGAAGIYGANNGVNGTGRFYNPYGLALAADGSLLVSDTYNELLRVVIVPFQLSLQTSGGSSLTTLSWNTVIGKSYQAQFKSSFAAGWTNLGSALTAAHTTLSVTDNATDPMRVYRVLRVN